MINSLRATPQSIVLILVGLFLVGCGGSGDQGGSAQSETESSQAAVEAEPESVTTSESASGDMSASDTDTGSDSDAMAQADQSSSNGPSEATSDSMSDSMSGSESESQSSASEEVVTVDDDGVAQVRIGGTDQMQYTVNEFSVEAGQEVELTFVHEGDLPVNQMGHNVVILPSGDDYMTFGRELTQSGEASLENDYLPESMRDGLIAYTDMIGGGETTTVRFTAPDTPGDYPFLCTFPGHYPMMNGVMTVR